MVERWCCEVEAKVAAAAAAAGRRRVPVWWGGLDANVGAGFQRLLARALARGLLWASFPTPGSARRRAVCARAFALGSEGTRAGAGPNGHERRPSRALTAKCLTQSQSQRAQQRRPVLTLTGHFLHWNATGARDPSRIRHHPRRRPGSGGVRFCGPTDHGREQRHPPRE